MIHQYKRNGYNIVIDGNSGKIHSVDEAVYDIVKILDKECYIDEEYESVLSEDKREARENLIRHMGDKHNIDEEEAMKIISEIEHIIDEGELFSKDLFKELSNELKGKMNTLKAICLHVAHDCNMNCEYCFAGKGEYSGEKSLMNLETAKKAIDFLVANSHGRKNLEVDFFGGEPLLNWNVCKETVKYARDIEDKCGKKFRFTLTTNGLLLDDDVIDFSNREMENVVLSLDGRKEINDAMRKSKNGRGTYDLVVDKFMKLAKSRGHKNYYVRGTYTKRNLDFAKDIIHMADLGFKELSMEPVVTSSENAYAITCDDIEKIMENYDVLSDEIISRTGKENAFNFYHYDVDFEKGPCLAKRVSGCGVGSEYLAITPEGDIYPCHQFVGDEKYLLGNLDEGIKYADVMKEFKECNVYSRKDCIYCFAKLYCSGGCSANAYHQKGDIKEVYELSCHMHKRRIENSIVMEFEREKS